MTEGDVGKFLDFLLYVGATNIKAGNDWEKSDGISFTFDGTDFELIGSENTDGTGYLIVNCKDHE